MRLKFELSSIPRKVQSIKSSLVALVQDIIYFSGEFFSFHMLVLIYVVNTIVVKNLHRLPLIPKPTLSKMQGNYSRFYVKFVSFFDRNRGETISKLDIIRLAIRNMQVKKTRTLITIGGVAIGIGAIVFLVSVGYGLQKLVIGRVARLDELRQVDIAPQAGSRIRIDDKILSDIKSYTNVADVYPLIAVVGRVNYQNSVSDMAVYVVTNGYLEKSAIKPVEGAIFDSNEISVKLEYSITVIEPEPEVAGVQDIRTEFAYLEELSPVSFQIYPDTWVRVRKEPNPNSELLGLTKRVEGAQDGRYVAGSTYLSDTPSGTFATNIEGVQLGRWVKTKVYLWDETDCDAEVQGCIDGKYLAKVDTAGDLVQETGYIAEINLSVTPLSPLGSVLGTSTTTVAQNITDLTTETTTATDTETVSEAAPAEGQSVIVEDGDWVEIVDGTESAQENAVDTIAMSSNAVRQAVVNRAMLQILNITEGEAVGKTFTASFVIPTNLLAESKKRTESETAEYTIVGVTPDDSAPVFYVPFIDLRSLGIVNYSQLKVVSSDQESLDTIRKQIEASGFATTSVVDTVEQITGLFATIRLVLGVMGMIALAVASLGMFNTLTVSLLERSREVGLMKAMGMTTMEVQELFLTESIIMGFCAGLAGLLVGWTFGKAASLLLTVFSVAQGQGFINISYIPFSFVAVIMILSFFVGIGTGIFPAKRSRKISALDALRYE